MALPLTQTENKRITTILQDMQNETYSICLERPTLLEQYWQSKQGKGKHPYIQRAEALAYVYTHREVDHMVQIVADIYTETVNKHINTRGGQYIPGFYSMTCHQGFGEATGALPNGRPAGARFSNGISPSDGADSNGPTAVLNSAASLDNRHWVNCCALNLKFEKNTVLNKKGRETIASLMKTFFRLGGMQAQINVLDTKQLLEARENPQKHPGLLVRISGYCAYFHDLSPEVQDEIIERTTHCAN